MRRLIKYGSQAGLLTVVFAAILVFVYLIALQHDHTWDLSQGTQNRLDQKTLNILQALTTDVDIKVFDKKGETSAAAAKDLLAVYQRHSRHIRSEIIDPDTHPDMAGKYGVEHYGQTVVIGREGREYLDRVDEEGLTTALFKLGKQHRKVVYCVEGHGERRIADSGKGGISQLKDALTKDNYDVKTLVLMRAAIPEDADLVLICAPAQAFLPAEITALEAYLGRGGRVFIALEPLKNAALDVLLGQYGITLADDLIVDPASRVLGADPSMPVVMTYGDVPALANFSLVTIYPTTRSLDTAAPAPSGVEITRLAQTSEQSWSETDLAAWNKSGTAALDARDRKGPRTVGILARKHAPASVELLVFGDSDFLSNTYLGLSGNKDLILNCLNMLLGEHTLITIEKRPSAFKPFVLTPSQGALVFWVPVVLVPFLLALAALAIFLRRRKA